MMDRSLAIAVTQAALTVAAMANRKTVNLSKEFDRWNRKLFGGELVKPKLRWMRSKTLGGSTKARRKGGQVEVQEVGISDFHENTMEEFAGILVHEMIHVSVLQRGIVERNGGHGPEFFDTLHRLQTKVPFEIPLTEDATHKKVSDHVKGKKRLAVLFNDDSIQVYSPKMSPDTILDTFRDRYSNDFFRTYRLRFIMSDDRELARYPMKRKMTRKSSLYQVSKDLLDRLLKEGELLIDVKRAA